MRGGERKFGCTAGFSKGEGPFDCSFPYFCQHRNRAPGGIGRRIIITGLKNGTSQNQCPGRALDHAAMGAPGKPSVSGFAGERRSSGMSELLPSRQNEGYGACGNGGPGEAQRQRVRRGEEEQRSDCAFRPQGKTRDMELAAMGPRGSPASAGSPGRGGAAERLRFPPTRWKQRMRSLRRRRKGI